MFLSYLGEKIVNITQAAEQTSLVTCQGPNCDLCSLFETITATYNFFLAVSSVVAILAVIIAGLNYILSAGNRNLFRQSANLLKSGLIGFAVIITGWIVTNSLIISLGPKNSGSWWQFRCSSDNQETTQFWSEKLPYFSPFYEKLKTFSSVKAFLASPDKSGKITGPTDTEALLAELKSLNNGETLNFLAPAQVSSTDSAENTFLPLFSVQNNGEELSLKNAGEYWTLIQDQWANESAKQSNNNQQVTNADLLDQYLGTNNFTNNQSIIDSSGQVLNSASGTDFSTIFAQIGSMLKDYQTGQGDRTKTLLKDPKNADLAEIIASLADPNNPQVDSQKIIAVLTAEVMKMTKVMAVTKENTNGNNQTAQWVCQNYGGTWTDGKCQCDSNLAGQIDAFCRPLADLEQKCQNSGGSWVLKESGNQTNLCGEDNLSWDSPQYSNELPQVGSSVCQCQKDDCTDAEGSCITKVADDDGDGVINSQDFCPYTSPSEVKFINKDSASQYYGCGCSDLGMLSKQCPVDQCIGNNWAVYPTGYQDCQQGKLLAYSCKPVSLSFDPNCQKNNQYNGQNSNNNSGEMDSSGLFNQNSNINTATANPKNTITAGGSNTGANNPTSGSGKNAASSGKGINKGNSGNTKITDPNPGERGGKGMIPNNNDTGQAYGGVEGVKEALKRIYAKDKLRYLMIFKYVSLMIPSGGGGHTASNESGIIHVNFGLPVKSLDEVIIHETTHQADFSLDGWSSSYKNLEYIAVSNEIGGVGRVKEVPGQKEEVKVLEIPGGNNSTDRLECRGYSSRWVDRDIDPRGDMNPTAVASSASYAKGYGAPVSPTQVYGWPKGGEDYILRLNDYEHGRNELIMNRTNTFKCISKPPADLPQLTDKDYKEEQLQGCKEAKEIKLGG